MNNRPGIVGVEAVSLAADNVDELVLCSKGFIGGLALLEHCLCALDGEDAVLGTAIHEAVHAQAQVKTKYQLQNKECSK